MLNKSVQNSIIKKVWEVPDATVKGIIHIRAHVTNRKKGVRVGAYINTDLTIDSSKLIGMKLIKAQQYITNKVDAYKKTVNLLNKS